MQCARVLLGARKLVAINSKRGNKNFFKGRGAPSTGAHTSRGGYRHDAARLASYTFIAPDLTDFKLLPYVSVLTMRSPKHRRRLLKEADTRGHTVAQATAEEKAQKDAIERASNA